jgi:hypothetical protein
MGSFPRNRLGGAGTEARRARDTGHQPPPAAARAEASTTGGSAEPPAWGPRPAAPDARAGCSAPRRLAAANARARRPPRGSGGCVLEALEGEPAQRQAPLERRRASRRRSECARWRRSEAVAQRTFPSSPAIACERIRAHRSARAGAGPPHSAALPASPYQPNTPPSPATPATVEDVPDAQAGNERRRPRTPNPATGRSRSHGNGTLSAVI